MYLSASYRYVTFGLPLHLVALKQIMKHLKESCMKITRKNWR